MHSFAFVIYTHENVLAGTAALGGVTYYNATCVYASSSSSHVSDFHNPHCYWVQTVFIQQVVQKIGNEDERKWHLPYFRIAGI